MGKGGIDPEPKRRAKGGVIEKEVKSQNQNRVKLAELIGIPERRLRDARQGKDVAIDHLQRIVNYKPFWFNSLDDISDQIVEDTSSNFCPESIIAASTEYLATATSACEMFRSLLDLGPSVGSDLIAKRLLDSKRPLEDFCQLVMENLRGALLRDLNTEQGDALRKFRDYATMLSFRREHVQAVFDSIRVEEKNFVESPTTVEPLVVLQFARALGCEDTPSQIIDEPGRLFEKNDRQFIPTNEKKLFRRNAEEPDKGVQRSDEEFLCGLAWQLGIPLASQDLAKAINRKLERYAGSKKFPIRIAILYSENRRDHIESLRSKFKLLIFIQLPKHDEPEYTDIASLRSDIDARINRDGRIT